MLEATGDIWQYAKDKSVDAVCVLTNMTVASKKLIMGGGQAREARERYPQLPSEWGSYYGEDWFPGQNITTVYQEDNGYAVVSFPTKTHPSEDSNLGLIRLSAVDLVGAADDYEWDFVVLPRPGCGLGGLKWDDVSPVLARILDDRFTVITF